MQLQINTNILTPHLHNHLCTLWRPPSLSLDRISSDLVPMATAPYHQVLDNDWELGLGSPCRGSKPAACASRRPPTQRPLGDRTQPPRLPRGPGVTRDRGVTTCFTPLNLQLQYIKSPGLVGLQCPSNRARPPSSWPAPWILDGTLDSGFDWTACRRKLGAEDDPDCTWSTTGRQLTFVPDQCFRSNRVAARVRQKQWNLPGRR